MKEPAKVPTFSPSQIMQNVMLQPTTLYFYRDLEMNVILLLFVTYSSHFGPPGWECPLEKADGLRGRIVTN